VVVPCEAPGKLADAVTELLRDADRMDRMGTEGRKWAVEQFDWDRLTRRTADLLGFEEPAVAG
jgi:glycosyltransferase involved in cell wall biosynthesis